MNRNLYIVYTVILCLGVYTGCKSKIDEHAGHNHEQELHEGHADEEKEEHTGETEEEHASHTGAEDTDSHEGEISVTEEVAKLAGITISKAVKGAIKEKLILNGEIDFNEDRVIHITPRFSGIAKEAKFKIGDYVKEGDIVAVIESNESMSLYSLKSSLTGRIIEKHILPGEHVSNEESIYVIADMNSVWVNLSIYLKDAHKVKIGQTATIKAIGSELTTEGIISYVTPMIDAQTRRVTARVVLSNKGGVWRPGTFVSASVAGGDGETGVLVKKEAVQIVNEESVLFVQHEKNSFKPVDVIIGESDSEHIIILDGIQDGTEYVSNGAFELKAKIVTSALGEHAGHNH